MTAPDRIGQKVRVVGDAAGTMIGMEGVTIPTYDRDSFTTWPKGKAVVMLIGAPWVTVHDIDELEVIE